MPLRRRHRSELRLLLLQVRSDPRPLEQERLCFLERCGVTPDQLDCVNLVEEPELSWRRIEEADVVLMGGAGAHAAYDDHRFTRPLHAAIERILAEDRPFFGSCFGHQVLARVLGGTVVPDLAREELGTFDVELTAAGMADPLFAGYPRRFPVHLGHHDRVEVKPPELIHLATSERCPYQVFRVEGRRAYSTQFHCEMTADHMRQRLLIYAREYFPGCSLEEARDLLDRRLRPSLEADLLLGRFLDLLG